MWCREMTLVLNRHEKPYSHARAMEFDGSSTVRDPVISCRAFWGPSHLPMPKTIFAQHTWLVPNHHTGRFASSIINLNTLIISDLVISPQVVKFSEHINKKMGSHQKFPDFAGSPALYSPSGSTTNGQRPPSPRCMAPPKEALTPRRCTRTHGGQMDATCLERFSILVYCRC